jgi:hypothetical protein
MRAKLRKKIQIEPENKGKKPTICAGNRVLKVKDDAQRQFCRSKTIYPCAPETGCQSDYKANRDPIA